MRTTLELRCMLHARNFIKGVIRRMSVLSCASNFTSGLKVLFNIDSYLFPIILYQVYIVCIFLHFINQE